MSYKNTNLYPNLPLNLKLVGNYLQINNPYPKTRPTICRKSIILYAYGITTFIK